MLNQPPFGNLTAGPNTSDVCDWHTGCAGVSLVICCHNSASRLTPTLEHIAAQCPTVPWELIIVDNACTDKTAQVAETVWPYELREHLRIIPEPVPGLVYARQTGFAHARYEFVCFVDDDNWIGTGWIDTVAEIMSSDPAIGVCCGINYPVCESTPPFWFDEFSHVLAVSSPDVATGDITDGAMPPGAGLTIRKSAWQEVVRNGFRFLCVGRQGNALNSGEDSELCIALQMAGWTFRRDPRLQLKHFLPSNRLQWSYIRRVFRGYGKSTVKLDPYFFRHSRDEKAWRKLFRDHWCWHMLATVVRFLRYWRALPVYFRSGDGDSRVTHMEVEYGRLLGFIYDRAGYSDNLQRVRRASWCGKRRSVSGGLS